MKCTLGHFPPAVLSVVLALLPSASAVAQQAPAAREVTAKSINIRKIEQAKVPTPEYQLLKGQFMGQVRNWYAVNIVYRTDPDWIDELTFTYYLMARSKEAGKKYTMFRGEVTYINIQKGEHKSDIYLHPSTLARYGEIEGIAVIVNAQGRMVAMESLPKSAQRWWEQFPPVDGYLLNRMQTPFAMINFDDYEAIKPRAGEAR
jgi:hypothetical protein